MDEIDAIILKYGIDKYFPKYKKRLSAMKVLSQYFIEQHRKSKIMLVGVRPEAIYYTKECLLSAKCMVEDVVWENTQGVKGRLLNTDAEIILVSLAGKGEIEDFLYENNIKYKDIYALFELSGLYFEDEYYKLFDSGDSYYSWDDDNDYRWDEHYQMEYHLNFLRYKRTNDELLKRRYAEKCLFLSLYVRDFLLFDECICMAQNAGCEVDLLGLKDDVNRVLSDMKLLISRRKKEDILVFWIDGIPYGKTENMPFWNEVKSKAVSFSNMYTVTPNTKPTLRTMFCEKREVSDRGYKIKEINESNSPLIRDLKRLSFKIKTISGYYGVIAKSIEINKVLGFRAPASLILWHMVRQLLEDDSNQVIISHMFVESHYPYLSMTGNGYVDSENIRRVCSEKKADEQLRFYEGFIPTGASCIYMSDHGRNGGLVSHHINFDVVTKNGYPHIDDKLLSLMDFRKIIGNIIEKNIDPVGGIDHDSVPIESFDYYSKRSVMNVIKNRLVPHPFQFGFVGEIHKDYCAVCYSTGIKWAVSIDRFEAELPNPYDKVQVSGVSENVFCDILEYPYGLIEEKKYKYAKLLHELYNLALRRINERMILIEKALCGFEDGEVVVRMGGPHTLRLYEMLSDKARNKICYIIDNNSECICRKLGKEILDLDNFLVEKRKNIKAVLLSSYEHISELRCEGNIKYASYYVLIDIYELFEQNSLECSGDFYKGLQEIDYIKALYDLENM